MKDCEQGSALYIESSANTPQDIVSFFILRKSPLKVFEIFFSPFMFAAGETSGAIASFHFFDYLQFSITLLLNPAFQN